MKNSKNYTVRKCISEIPGTKNFLRIFFITSLLVFGATTIGTAQVAEGDIMLGSDLGSGLVATGNNGLFGFNIGLNDGAGYNLGISPKAGYFLNNNFLIGAAVNLGFSKSPENDGQSTKTTVYGFQGLVRYYIRPAEVEVDELPARMLFFMENNAGLSGVNIKDGPSTNGFAFGFGPGLAYFVTDNVALETTFKYNGLIGGGTQDYQHSIGFNLGVQVFLPLSRAENILDSEN